MTAALAKVGDFAGYPVFPVLISQRQKLSFEPQLLHQSPRVPVRTPRLQGGLDFIQNRLLCPCLLVPESIEYLMSCLGVLCRATLRLSRRRVDSADQLPQARVPQFVDAKRFLLG